MTLMACELGVDLRDAKDGEFGPRYKDGRQFAFAGGLPRVDKILDYLMNVSSTLRRLDATPVSALRSTGFSVLRS